MGLTDDLKPWLSDFLAEDVEERKRRADFLEKWEETRSLAKELMQEVVLLLSDTPAFSAEVKSDKLSVALSITFKDASKVSTTDTLTLMPDDDYVYIICDSTLDDADEPDKKLYLSQLDTTVIENKIRKFFRRFLNTRRYTGMVMQKISRP